MDIASVFEWFAQESSNIAQQVNEPMRRDTLTKLALLWAAAAADLRSALSATKASKQAPSRRPAELAPFALQDTPTAT